MIGSLEIAPDTRDLVQRGAKKVAVMLHNATLARRFASLVLSGGATPRRMYELLGSPPLAEQIDWKYIHVFWGDERCVPPESPESNYRMAREALLDRVALPPGNIHRIETELPPEAAASRYEEEIKQTVPLDAGRLPVFDVVLLGLGEDGHTASLFPYTPALDERERLVTSLFVHRLQTHRISMTIPLLNNARDILFFVSGVGKAKILHSILSGELTYPAQMIRPIHGNLLWMVDSDAASLLEKVPK